MVRGCRRLLAGAFGLLLAGTLAGCGGTGQAGTSTTTTDLAQSPKWSAEATRLVHAETGTSAHKSNVYFAYQSRPVDITHDGIYTLDYGPVDKYFAVHRFPIAFEFPSDAHFQVTFTSDGSIVILNGQPYFQQREAVANLPAPYKDFTGWIYS
jgi:hypothetical protein